MRIALLSDIHSNREALEACLSHAAEMAVDRYIFLGDYVGYGADPNWVVTTIRGFVAKGALALLGNHDQAIFERTGSMNPIAETAMNWTRENLGYEEKEFLKKLPLQKLEGERLYVHATADSPSEWHYITGPAAARRTFEATSARLTFCGHVHVPQIFRITSTAKIVEFAPTSNTPIELSSMWRWLNIIGSVGQPRDQITAAAYAVYDDVSNTITHYRVAYDAETAAAKIRAAGLPDVLAQRLLRGS